MSDARPTLGDVARAAGVHKATASRALNDATVGRVNAGTVARVRAAAEQLGYRPNRHARGLRTRRSSTVGLVLPDIVTPIYAPIVRASEQTLAARGYTTLLVNTDLDPERERSAFDLLRERQVDGFIASTAGLGVDLAAQLEADNTPIVNMMAGPDSHAGRQVETDQHGAVGAVVDHLAALGHTRIAYLTPPVPPRDPRERASAFVAAVARIGLDPQGVVVRGSVDATASAARSAALALLTERPEITAVVAHNDVMAVGVLRAAHLLGRRCPDQLSVVGFNDLAVVAELTPPLTTVHFPAEAIGVAAAEMLLDAMAGAPIPPPRRMALPLIVRESTAGPRLD